MNKFIKTISLLLTAITLLGSLSWLSVIGVSATSSKEKDEGPTIEEILEGYLTKKYDTPEANLHNGTQARKRRVRALGRQAER